jgi:protein-S-isoprenylcysteine O-methyltransferase Ste14
MRATEWEFKIRALIFGLIFGGAFSLYGVDRQNAAAALADRLGALSGVNAALIARLLFALAACLLVVAAITRTWGSSYLHASVVYAPNVKTESLVADGPYRYVRNPLYFANILLAMGMGALMSRAGFFVAVIAMTIFCYRLIFREEADLERSQGERYTRYLNAVPRMWPSLSARAPSSGREAVWAEGFRAEFWCWGLAVSVAAFAITLSATAFYVILAISLAVFWLSSSILRKRG